MKVRYSKDAIERDCYLKKFSFYFSLPQKKIPFPNGIFFFVFVLSPAFFKFPL